MAKLKINTNDVTSFLLEKTQFKRNSKIRSGLYVYLGSLGSIETYLDICLEGIGLLDSELAESLNTISTDENRQLRDLLDKVTTAIGISKIIQYFTNNPDTIHDKVYMREVLESTIDRAILIYRQEPSIYRLIVELTLALRCGIHNHELKVIKNFFEQTNTVKNAVEFLLKEKNTNSIEAAASISNTEGIDVFLELFTQGQLTDRDVYGFRNGFAWVGNIELQNVFNEKINEFTHNKFAYPPQRDWQAEKTLRLQRDIELLFDKEAFIEEVRTIFLTEEQAQFTRDDLFELKKEQLKDENLTNDIVIGTLREMAKNEPITIESFTKRFSVQENWDWFKINELYRYLQNKEELILREDRIDWIKDWCFSALSEADFKTAIRSHSNGSITYRYLEAYLAFFFMKFDLSFSKEVILEMLLADWQGLEYIVQHERLTDFVYQRVEQEEFKQAVITNLRNGIEAKYILANHIDTVRKYHFQESMPFVIDAVKGKILDEHHKHRALETLIELGANVSVFEEIIDCGGFDFKIKVIQHIQSIDGQRGINHLLKILKVKGEEAHCLKVASLLIRASRIEGLRYYTRWLEKSKMSTDLSFNQDDVAKLTQPEATKLLLSMLYTRYDPNFVNQKFDSLSEIILQSIALIALQSEQHFRKINKDIQNFIKSNTVVNNSVKELNYFLLNLEQRYYLSKGEKISFQEVISLL